MSNKRTQIFIIVSLVIIVCVGVMLVIFNTPSKPYDTRAPKEAETSGSELITLNNSDGLLKILLPAQYDVAKKEINDYIHKYIDPNSKTASIVGSPKLSSSGVVVFAVKARGGTSDTFTVNIDRWTHYDKLIFSVPKQKYTKTLQVYSN